VIALDTNVLLRLLLRDDSAQAEQAQALFDANADRDGSLFVSDVVLAELAWVLRSRCDMKPSLVAKALHALLGNATLAWQSPGAVADALELHKTGGVDFADCLVACLAAAQGCEAVATFDRGMRSLPGVRLL
jgi:predicted nucleic-acid-binding protein